jgi:hypothetical protein
MVNSMSSFASTVRSSPHIERVNLTNRETFMRRQTAFTTAAFLTIFTGADLAKTYLRVSTGTPQKQVLKTSIAKIVGVNPAQHLPLYQDRRLGAPNSAEKKWRQIILETHSLVVTHLLLTVKHNLLHVL